ncbi:5-oxoprolinase subunit PxpB [Magnetospirillum sp. 15-1]|uniref:5-oxoprolinase subunit PxpB n=1 Tax=Magnetospirillum sp. 15-1 TaxID=1979370 RepID=UPI000BBB8D79|nr:5-oxoprolinase subunit PxpB [Magnetospirillum sp. 15-1]
MRILPVGDTAFSVEFGDSISEAANARVMALNAALDGVAGIVETVPSFRALLVVFDPGVARFNPLAGTVARLAEGLGEASSATGRHHRIRVRYDGPDLEAVAAACGLSAPQVIDVHAGGAYRVHMLGFMPGFAYMAELPPSIRLPRRAEPRLKVPAGSLAMADAMTAIYPWDSPGGWHLIGSTDMRLFDQTASPPALLAPGDTVTFEPV